MFFQMFWEASLLIEKDGKASFTVLHKDWLGITFNESVFAFLQLNCSQMSIYSVWKERNGVLPTTSN